MFTNAFDKMREYELFSEEIVVLQILVKRNERSTNIKVAWNRFRDTGAEYVSS